MSTVLMTFLVGLFLRVLFFEMVNGIVSLISLSDISLLVYRNAAVFYIFCIQQVYFVHWWVLVVIWWHIQDFLCVASYWQFYFLLIFSFTWIPFISCSFLIVVARTSKNVFNKIGNSEHSCLIHVVKGNAFSFSLLSMMLAVCLTYTVWIMLR